MRETMRMTTRTKYTRGTSTIQTWSQSRKRDSSWKPDFCVRSCQTSQRDIHSVDCTSDLNAITVFMNIIHLLASMCRGFEICLLTACAGGEGCAGLGSKQEKRSVGRNSFKRVCCTRHNIVRQKREHLMKIFKWWAAMLRIPNIMRLLTIVLKQLCLPGIRACALR